MGNKRRTSNRNRTGSVGTKPAKKTWILAKRIKAFSVVLVLGFTAAVGLAAYKQQYDINHDLSVIGNGLPTVVQVHDPGCSLCQQLKRNVNSVKPAFKENIQFRIADIKTNAGRGFASRHRVQHVTLLLFDGAGKRVATIEGVKDKEYLRSRFESLESGHKERAR